MAGGSFGEDFIWVICKEIVRDKRWTNLIKHLHAHTFNTINIRQYLLKLIKSNINS